MKDQWWIEPYLPALKRYAALWWTIINPLVARLLLSLAIFTKHVLLFMVVLEHKLLMHPLNPHLYGIFSLFIHQQTIPPLYIRKLTKYFFHFYGFFVPFWTFWTFARRGTARPKSQKSQRSQKKSNAFAKSPKSTKSPQSRYKYIVLP